MARKIPTLEDTYIWERDEADALVESLARAGYLAKRDFSGGCRSHPETGEHHHPDFITVTLTAAQARKLVS